MRAMSVLFIYLISFFPNPFHSWKHWPWSRPHNMVITQDIQSPSDPNGPYINGVSYCDVHDATGWYIFEPDWTIGFSAESCQGAIDNGIKVKGSQYTWKHWVKI